MSLQPVFAQPAGNKMLIPAKVVEPVTVYKPKTGRKGKKGTYYGKKGKRSKYINRPTVFPNKWKFTTRYFEPFKIVNSTLGVVGYYTISANGLYDPDYTGSGHQPIGFDQMMSFYDHYTVIGSKIKVQIQNMSDQHDVIVGIQTSDDNVPSITNNIGTLIENGLIKYTKLVRQGSDGNFLNNTKSSTTLTKSVNIKKFMGRPNILSEDDLRGTQTTNPAEGVFFHICFQQSGASADAVQISISFEVDYVAILTEPKLITAS